jgi:PKD repeat protein
MPCIANSNFSLTFSGTPQLWYASPAYFGNVQAAQWSWGDGQFSNQLFTSHTYSAAGMYNVCLTVTTSCGTSSTCINSTIFKSMNTNNAMVTINVVPQMPTGISNRTEEDASVNLYPNPNNGSFKVNIENVNSENVVISIYNILGEKVYSSIAKVSNGQVKSDIHAENFSNGTYYIQVKSDARSYNLKTVINK